MKNVFLSLIILFTAHSFAQGTDCNCVSKFKEDFLKANPYGALAMSYMRVSKMQDGRCALSSTELYGNASIYSGTFITTMTMSKLLGGPGYSIDSIDGNRTILKSQDGTYISLDPKTVDALYIYCH